MEVLILNTSFKSIALLDTFDSFIWVDRYFKCGYFEIYIPVDSNFLSILVHDNYLYLEDSEHVMIVEDRQIPSDVENGTRLIVTGRPLESILDRRIIWVQTILSGSFQSAIEKILNENIINPTNADRKISNFIFEASTDPVITALTVFAQCEIGASVLDVIEKLCESVSIGFKVTLTDDNKFKFKLYAGIDRSYDQSINPYVTFSPNFENLLNSNYIDSKKPLKTVTLVGGDGEGPTKRNIIVNSPSGAGTELSRREMFTDASDLSFSLPNGVYKNLFNKEKVSNGYINLTTGNFENNATYASSRYGDLISVTNGTSYYLSGYTGAMAYILYNVNGTFNSKVDITAPSAWSSTITGYIVPLFYSGITTPQLNVLQIEIGTVASAYVAFGVQTEEDYNNQLTQRGLEDLANNTFISSFEGQTDTSRMYRYGKDFYMGDIVQLQNEFGMEAKSRVIEFVMSQDSSGVNTYPTFSSI